VNSTATVPTLVPTAWALSRIARSVAGDADVLHHVQRHEVPAQVGVLDRAEGVANLLARDGHWWGSVVDGQQS
jgi:hypothetical protein